MIKSFILRQNNTTPYATPCQAQREGSELMTTESGTQELHFFPVRRETQTSKRGLRIRLEGWTSPGSLFLALLTPLLKCHHSFDILAAIKEQKTSPSKSWYATCLVLNKPIDLPLLIYQGNAASLKPSYRQEIKRKKKKTYLYCTVPPTSWFSTRAPHWQN